MSMSIGGGGEDEPMMEMNMTPLIDVLLVLLVMFIITIPVMTHAVKLDMPRPTNAAQQSDPVVINLEIDFDGTVLWNGSPVTVKNITLKVEHIDVNGKLREFSRSIERRLEPGQQDTVGTGIQDIPDTSELGRRVRVTVVAAKIQES